MMNFFYKKHIWLLFSLLIACNTANDNRDQSLSQTQLMADENNAGLILPQGFQALVVAEEVGQARQIAINENGDMYVILKKPNNNGSMVALRDTTHDGKADIIEYFGDYAGSGLEIHQGYLYFATDTSVYRTKLTPGELVPQNEPELVVGNFIDQGQHAAKPIAFDQEGNIYVNIGAPANACQEQIRTKGSPGKDPCPLLEKHAGIWQYSANQLNQNAYADGKRYTTGIRHAVAIAWNDNLNQLFAVQHGRDQLNTLFPEHYDNEDNANLPAEEFLQINEGDDFGWPYCYYDGMNNVKELAPEYGGDGEKIGRCDQFKDPIYAFPAHIAPNDLLFYNNSQFPEKYKYGAFVAFHGSWNRAPLPQEGYNITFLAFENGKPQGEHEIFADGFANDEKIQSPGDADYRPCGIAVGPDGSLYVVDSKQGNIWRIFYKE
ncbi:MAG: PQQ-dependent sugar dehydrogenase [Cyclobacteriaceae bacterium]